MSPEERAGRAVLFQQMMDDGLKDAFSDLRASIMEEWSRAAQAQDREYLWQQLKALEKLQSHIVSALSERRIPRSHDPRKAN